MDAEIVKLFSVLDHQAVDLFYRWEIFTQLFRSGEDNIRIINRSGSNVFVLLHNLILDDVFLTLSRMTDAAKNRDDENLSIRNMLGKAMPVLSEETRNKIENEVSIFNNLVKNIRSHRNKRMAHSDLAHAVKLKPLPPVTVGELDDALESFRRIMREFHISIYNADNFYKPITIAYGCDGNFLLRILRKAHEAKVSNIELNDK